MKCSFLGDCIETENLENKKKTKHLRDSEIGENVILNSGTFKFTFIGL